MPASEAQRRASKKWNEANMSERYDRINILAPKGQKAVIAEAAQRANESISQYILTAVQTRMDSENQTDDE